MDIKKLQALVIDALEDVKAQDIRIYDTTHLTSMFDSIAVASGTSNRQTKALAASVRDKVKAAGGEIVSIEGENTGEWVLVDLGDMVVHIMQPAIRAYYRLEELWGDREIRPSKPAAKKTAKKAVNKAAAQSHGDTAAKTRKTTGKPASKTAKKTAASPRPAAKTSAKTGAKTGATAAAKTTSRTSVKTASKTAGKSAAASQAKTAAKSPAKKAAPRRAAAKG